MCASEMLTCYLLPLLLCYRCHLPTRCWLPDLLTRMPSSASSGAVVNARFFNGGRPANGRLVRAGSADSLISGNYEQVPYNWHSYPRMYLPPISPPPAQLACLPYCSRMVVRPPVAICINSIL